ncbi:MAG: response regulator [Tenericutes bacterium]|nr:response regulator [Mycoplasmatota bacterium]
MSDKLNEKSELYKKIVKSFPEYVAFKNNEGKYEIVSEQVNTLYKDKFDSIEGLTIDELYSKEAAIEVRRQDKEVLDKLDKVESIFAAETSNGTIMLDSIKMPILDDKQKVMGVLSVSRDITELIRVKEKLEVSTKIQKTVIEVAQSFVSMSVDNFDFKVYDSLKKLGGVIQADRTYLFKYNFLENTMDNIFEWCSLGIEPQIKKQKNIPVTQYLNDWVNLHRANKCVMVADTSELEIDSRLYNIFIPREIKSIFTIPIFVEDKCFGFLGFESLKEVKPWNEIEDILKIIPGLYSSLISRYEMLKELDEAKSEAHEASTIQTDFIAKVTHEIKTPINGLSNALYLLEDSVLDEDQRQYTDIMTYSLEVLNTMVYNILNYSKIEADKLIYKASDINLENEIVKLIKMNKYMANSKDLGIYLNYDYSIPSILTTDIEKLRQILNNFLQNAIKYTNYGYIEIKISEVKRNNPYVDIQFEIIDTGIGISEVDLNHIFEEFYQVGDILNKNPSGTGLGLTIANELISFLKGELVVESKERKGSNFKFVLTFYSPNIEKVIPLDLKVVYIDISNSYHSNIESLISTHFTSVDICKLNNLEDYYKNKYDVIFVYTNKETDYLESIDNLKPFLNNFESGAKKVLLFDNNKEQVYMDSLDLFDYYYELPIRVEVLIDELTSVEIQHKEIKKTVTHDVSFESALSILLVDDNNINRKVMGKLLRNMNLNVTEASNGYEAIEFSKTRQFDIIFMDIFMPGIDGFESSRRIRAIDGISSSTPIIAVTANDATETLEKAMQYEMNGVLEKPLRKEKLEELLTEYFGDISFKAINPENDLPIFDEVEFESFYDDLELRKDIIETLLDERISDIRKIEDAYKTKSLNQIYKAAHYLKGSFTYLSAKKALKLVMTIMELCNTKRLDDVLNLEQSLIYNYNQLIETLIKYQKK